MDTRISLHKLDVFCRVVECGTVTAAAVEFGVAQPVITGHLRTLDARLGVRLFERRGRRLELTEAGEAAYAWASEVIARTRAAAPVLDGYAGAAGAAVTIAACSLSSAVIVPDVIVQFSQQEPAAVIQVRALTTETALQAVADGSCDLAIVSYATDAPAASALELEQLFEEEIVLVAAPDHPAPAVLNAEEIGLLTYVCTPAGSARRRSLERQLAELGVASRRITVELGHGEALRSAVRRGVGVALVSRISVRDDLAEGTLREIAVSGASLRCSITLATRRGHRWTALQRRLVAAVRSAGAAPATVAVR